MYSVFEFHFPSSIYWHYSPHPVHASRFIY